LYFVRHPNLEKCARAPRHRLNPFVRRSIIAVYQARWRPELRMAHILPHWNWPDRVGQVTPVHVYTSGDEAELFLNGKSLGRKTRGPRGYRLRWDGVVYQPGELKIVVYKNHKVWARDAMKTTGPATQLTLTADRSTVHADGNDLSFVTVTVADHSGSPVHWASGLLSRGHELTACPVWSLG
jgi:beta-galactosidase